MSKPQRSCACHLEFGIDIVPPAGVAQSCSNSAPSFAEIRRCPNGAAYRANIDRVQPLASGIGRHPSKLRGKPAKLCRCRAKAWTEGAKVGPVSTDVARNSANVRMLLAIGGRFASSSADVRQHSTESGEFGQVRLETRPGIDRVKPNCDQGRADVGESWRDVGQNWRYPGRRDEIKQRRVAQRAGGRQASERPCGRVGGRQAARRVTRAAVRQVGGGRAGGPQAIKHRSSHLAAHQWRAVSAEAASGCAMGLRAPTSVELFSSGLVGVVSCSW